jgi:primosomal protein N' (replication factor Y)
MTKKAGRFRAQLLLQSNHRHDLNQELQQLCELGDQHALGKRLRWSIDVDPIDLF